MREHRGREQRPRRVAPLAFFLPPRHDADVPHRYTIGLCGTCEFHVSVQSPAGCSCVWWHCPGLQFAELAAAGIISLRNMHLTSDAMLLIVMLNIVFWRHACGAYEKGFIQACATVGVTGAPSSVYPEGLDCTKRGRRRSLSSSTAMVGEAHNIAVTTWPTYVEFNQKYTASGSQALRRERDCLLT